MNKYNEEEREKYINEASNIVSIIKAGNIDSFLLGFVLTWFFVNHSPKKYQILRNKISIYSRKVKVKIWMKPEDANKYNIDPWLIGLTVSFPYDLSRFKRENKRIIDICIKNKMLTEENMK